jgi:sec-independent protein translocase protein TatA
MGLGTPEIILIVLALLLLFGGKKLPELMRGLGSGVKEFKKATNLEDDDHEPRRSYDDRRYDDRRIEDRRNDDRRIEDRRNDDRNIDDRADDRYREGERRTETR